MSTLMVLITGAIALLVGGAVIGFFVRGQSWSWCPRCGRVMHSCASCSAVTATHR